MNSPCLVCPFQVWNSCAIVTLCKLSGLSVLKEHANRVYLALFSEMYSVRALVLFVQDSQQFSALAALCTQRNVLCTDWTHCADVSSSSVFHINYWNSDHCYVLPLKRIKAEMFWRAGPCARGAPVQETKGWRNWGTLRKLLLCQLQIPHRL